jgi:hypothetical protein
MIKRIDGTKWLCTDEDMDEYGMKCEVLSGEINPDHNGDNDIKIKYEDGSVIFMKYRRFMFKFKELQ